MFKFHYQNDKKRKCGERFSGLQNGTIRGLQTRTSFRDYKSGQEGLQIGEASRVSNLGKEITNRGWNFKSEQQGFQIGAEQSLFFNKAVGLQKFCFKKRLLQTETATKGGL